MMTVKIRPILFHLTAILLLPLVTPSPIIAQSQALKNSRSKEAPPLSRGETPKTMIEAIQQRNSDIEKQEALLNMKEQRLQIMENEISSMIKKNTQILETIDQREAEKKAQTDLEQEERFRRISKIYEKMPPEDAAKRIDKMKESLALNLLRVIKPKSVAQIFIGLTPDKAARLSEQLSKKPR